MHRVPGTQLVFAHIPKAAGQAVKAALRIPNETGAHEVGVPADAPYYEPGFIRFCVVRDPIKRAMSAYRYNATHVDVGKGVRDFMRQHRLHENINEFLAYLEAENITPTRWTHFKLQTSYIAAAKAQIVLRQEQLASDIQILAPFYGKPIYLNRKNGTKADNITMRLTQQSRDYLARVYAADIEALGYHARG